jgi:ADP-L-glycero-D-manno-heptose 6-epimerase
MLLPSGKSVARPERVPRLSGSAIMSDMRIIVTGGAGFIGSALVHALNRAGERNILIVDRLGDGRAWRNLVPLDFADYLDADHFLDRLTAGCLGRPDLILHMGADSATTTTDMAWLERNNTGYTTRLARWCVERRVRFVYASSAAVYGDGRQGFADDEEGLAALRPLNAYGWSKLWFDRIARREGWLGKIAGLRFFNVYGPNEYHKGPMRSPVTVFAEQFAAEGRCRLFRSIEPGLADGEQRRDFVYIEDVAAATLHLAGSGAAGLFNIGTGEPATFRTMAESVAAALGTSPDIEWIDTPAHLRRGYQSYTCADIGRLRAAGFAAPFAPPAEGVRRTVDHWSDGERCLEP